MKLFKKKLPYTRNPKRAKAVNRFFKDWLRLVKRAKKTGLRIVFATDSLHDLELYYNDDYPDLILVDKSISLLLKKDGDT